MPYRRVASYLAKIIGIFLLSLGALPALAGENLRIAVAASLQPAFEELKPVFTQQTGLMIEPVYGASGIFVAQIQEGAPFDVFLSADTDYPVALQQAGLTANAPKVYAYGSLVLWALPDIDLNQRVAVTLNHPKVKRIALANPQLAPYGQQALNVLDYYQQRQGVQAKLIYGESISQVTQFIVTEQVQLAFTAKSVVLSPRFQAKGHWIEIPAESYQPIGQGAVILKYGATHHPEAAKRLMDFLFTPPAQTILERYGYRLP